MATRRKFKDDPVGARRQELLAARLAVKSNPSTTNTRRRVSAEKALLRAVNFRKGRKSAEKV